jgi:hypothetical protein
MCHFIVPFTITPEELFKKIQQAIAGHGKVTGDASSGSFTVRIPLARDIIGTYQVANQQVTVDISQKPGVVSCEKIEEAVREHING